jgi:hypothetical protein
MTEKTDKILLIAGCSHAAGSEINGSTDSVFNRCHSFGNVLARKLDRIPINIAQHGLSNQGIARVVMNWFHYQYNEKLQDVQVLVAWTESTRTELPSIEENSDTLHIITRSSDWLDETSKHYYNFNFASKGNTNDEISAIESAERFIATNETFMEISSAYYIILLQQFFKANDIKYMMCNTMHMFTSYVKQIENLLPLIDKTKYRDMMHDSEAFYIKYKDKGYTNTKAKYWHHGEEPHRLYAEDLYKFIGESKCF